jgi:hypothetical protein
VLLFGEMLGVLPGQEEEGLDDDGMPMLCAVDKVGFDIADPWALPEDEEYISQHQGELNLNSY